MVIKGNGAVNTMEAVKINTKEKERTKVTYHKSVFSSVLTGITCGAAILALAILVFLVGFILIHGVKNLTLEQFAWTYNTENVTMLPAIINTVTMTVLSLLLAAPLGIFSAIYLVEYANKRGKLVGLIRITAETLSGIPSIVYGLFGMLFFTKTLKMGYSMMSGACTLAIIVNDYSEQYSHWNAVDYANSRRSLKISSGFLSGSKLWTGSRKASYDF